MDMLYRHTKNELLVKWAFFQSGVQTLRVTQKQLRLMKWLEASAIAQGTAMGFVISQAMRESTRNLRFQWIHGTIAVTSWALLVVLLHVAALRLLSSRLSVYDKPLPTEGGWNASMPFSASVLMGAVWGGLSNLYITAFSAFI